MSRRHALLITVYQSLQHQLIGSFQRRCVDIQFQQAKGVGRRYRARGRIHNEFSGGVDIRLSWLKWLQWHNNYLVAGCLSDEVFPPNQLFTHFTGRNRRLGLALGFGRKRAAADGFKHSHRSWLGHGRCQQAQGIAAVIFGRFNIYGYRLRG